ncbi:DUF3822 family protein [Sphingobacterium anhuiense]|uniref:DUF3822 family protein n=1 Tax=Sphingobacterium anhuiense TaxID=493780 RepID=UPI003C306E2B
MNYISEKFNIHFLPEYTLSAKAGFSKDVIAVTDKQLNLNLLLEYDAENPKLDATQILSLPFRYVKVVIPHQSLTFIPKEVFQEDRLSEYAPYLVEHVPNHIHTYEMKNLGIVAVFEYDLILYNRWKALFPDAEIFPEFCIILDQAQDLVPIRGSVLGVHFVSDHLVDLYLFQNGQFMLYNSFDVHFADDLNYYILNIIQQFSLTDQVSKVLVSGEIPNYTYRKCLERYSTTIAHLESKSKAHINKDIEGINFKKYNTLFDAILCE